MPTVTSHDIEIYYEVSGDKSNPPILFCNGYPPPLGFVQQFYIPSFIDRFCCATFDVRGVGGSQAPEEDAEFSILRFAQDGLAVMDDLGWKSAHVWGASLGAMTGAKMAALEPARIRSLALSGFDPGAPNMHQKPYAETMRNRYNYLYQPLQPGLTPEEAAENMISFYGAIDNPRAQKLIAYYAAGLRAAPKKKMRQWSLLSAFVPLAANVEEMIAGLPDTAEPTDLARESLLDDLDKIKAPTLIVRGDDPIIHQDASLYALEHIENAELRISKKTKHSLSLAPELLADEADWFERRETEYSGRSASE